MGPNAQSNPCSNVTHGHFPVTPHLSLLLSSCHSSLFCLHEDCEKCFSMSGWGIYWPNTWFQNKGQRNLYGQILSDMSPERKKTTHTKNTWWETHESRNTNDKKNKFHRTWIRLTDRYSQYYIRPRPHFRLTNSKTELKFSWLHWWSNCCLYCFWQWFQILSITKLTERCRSQDGVKGSRW